MSERSFSQGASLVVAHRGASAELPENTLAAFERAIDLGADAVELDVRITADGHAVVCHDADVGRTTDGSGAVGELELGRIRELRTPDGRLAIPTLDEVLRACSGRVGVDVEMKHLPGEPGFDPDDDRPITRTLATLHDTAFDGPVLLSSFNPFSLDRVRELDADLSRGLLTVPTLGASEAIAFAAERACEWVLPEAGSVLEDPEGVVGEARAAGLRLGTWVVDDVDVARKLFAAGLDAVATNDPRTILAARVVP